MAEGHLDVRGLSVMRGGRRVVDDLSFAARAGHVTVLLGPNGAGKSTVLKAIAGVLPYQGRIEIRATDLAALPREDRARRVAYVPQHSALDAALAVTDVVAQGRFAHQGGRPGGGRTDREAVASAMERTDVTALAERSFDRLSYGERRRVLLARALATEAKLLLLDEPTAALDVGHALALFRVLRGLANDGCAVIVVLHQLQEAAAEADHAVLLDAGRLVTAGTPATVIASDPVRRVYGVVLAPAAQFACRLPAVDGEVP